MTKCVTLIPIAPSFWCGRSIRNYVGERKRLTGLCYKAKSHSIPLDDFYVISSLFLLHRVVSIFARNQFNSCHFKTGQKNLFSVNALAALYSCTSLSYVVRLLLFQRAAANQMQLHLLSAVNAPGMQSSNHKH